MSELNCIVRPRQSLTSDQMRLLGDRLKLWRRAEAAAGRRHEIEPTALRDLAAGELPQPMMLLIAQQRGMKLSDIRRSFAAAPNAALLNARLILITLRADPPELDPAFESLTAAIPPDTASVHRQ